MGSGSDWTDGDLETVIGEDEGSISSSEFRGGLEERRKSLSAMFLDNTTTDPRRLPRRLSPPNLQQDCRLDLTGRQGCPDGVRGVSCR